MKSTGNLWFNLFEVVEDLVRAVLANPLKMRAIASAKIRNDKVDVGFWLFFRGMVLWLNLCPT